MDIFNLKTKYKLKLSYIFWVSDEWNDEWNGNNFGIKISNILDTMNSDFNKNHSHPARSFSAIRLSRFKNRKIKKKLLPSELVAKFHT